MVGLEIGPLDRPLVARTEGRHIYYLDFNTTDEGAPPDPFAQTGTPSQSGSYFLAPFAYGAMQIIAQSVTAVGV